MADSSDATGFVSQWAYFVDLAREEELANVPRRPGSPEPWVFFIPPHVSDILFVDGLWDGVNADLDTMFDQWEEEDLEPQLAAKVAEHVRHFAKLRYPGDRPLTRHVGWVREEPDDVLRPIIAQERADVLRETLLDLADFLAGASNRGCLVTAAL